MATIYRNALLPAVAKWNSFSSIYHRFDKAFDKGYIDGVHVYGWMHYYQSKTWIEDKKIKRFLKAMGIEWAEFRNQEIDEEINDLRFYLKDTYEWDGSTAGENNYDYASTEESTVREPPTRSEIASMFNSTFAVGEEVTLTVAYGGSTKRYIGDHELPWSINELGVIETGELNTEQIRNTLETNPWYYFANSRHVPYVKDSAPYHLYDGGTLNTDASVTRNEGRNPSSRLLGTTIVSCKAGFRSDKDKNEVIGVFAYMNSGAFERVGEVFHERIATTDSGILFNGEAVKYTYSQKFKFTGMSTDNQLIDEILSWFGVKEDLNLRRGRINYRPVEEYREDLTYHTGDTLYKKALDQMAMYVDVASGRRTARITNSLFYDGWLRVEPASTMRRRHFVEMVATSLDIDEQVEKASAWERIAAYVIAIIAVVVAIFTYGASIAATGATIWGAVATGASYASLILVVGMYGLSMVGGLSAQNLVKNIGAFAQIVGYVAAVAGVMAAVKSAGNVLAQKTLGLSATEAASQAGVAAIKTEMLNQTLTDQVGALLSNSLEAATSKITNFVSLSGMDKASFIMDGLSTLTKGLNMYQDKEAQALNEELRVKEIADEEAESENLSNQLKNSAAIYVLMEDQLSSYDALNNMSEAMQSKIGQDENFSMWNSNTNSV